MNKFKSSVLFAVLAFAAATGQVFAQDLSIQQLSNPTPGTSFVGSNSRRNFTLRNDGSDAVFSEGQRVFVMDLPTESTFGNIFLGAQSDVTGGMDCSISAGALTCVAATGGLTFSDAGQLGRLVEETFISAGTATIPPAGGVCTIDPDNHIAEDDETNNDCFPDSVDLRNPPAITTQEWLKVSMWDNVARQYNHVAGQHTNVQMISEVGGGDIFSLNDIARHPNGTHYVFHRLFQSNLHRLGTFDPATGVADIGPTGTSFHDSAFTPGGTLYAVGRDMTLYSIDLATAVPTPHCDTGIGSPEQDHSALLWDSNTSELLQLANRDIIAIDTTSFPPNPADPCVSTVSPLDSRIDNDVMGAVSEGGQLFAVDTDGGLYYFERDGAVLDLAFMPHIVHGLVADPGGLPQPSFDCFRGGFSTIAGDNLGSILVGIDRNDASLSFIRDLPIQINALAFNRKDGKLYGVYSRRLIKIQPCTGEVLSTVEISQPSFYSGFEITPDGSAYISVNGGDLYTLDLKSGLATPLGGSARIHRALVVKDGMAIFDLTGKGDDTTDLRAYDLASYDATFTDTPLTYGAGQESGDMRWIRELATDPFSADLFGLLWRSNYSETGMTTSARPKLLVTIDTAGNVTTVGKLPSSAVGFALGQGQLIVDGFETLFEDE